LKKKDQDIHKLQTNITRNLSDKTMVTKFGIEVLNSELKSPSIKSTPSTEQVIFVFSKI